MEMTGLLVKCTWKKGLFLENNFSQIKLSRCDLPVMCFPAAQGKVFPGAIFGLTDCSGWGGFKKMEIKHVKLISSRSVSLQHPDESAFF